MPLDGTGYNTYSRVFARAANLIDDGWSKGSDARTSWGWPCNPLKSYAKRFCIRGAIRRAAYEQNADFDHAFKLFADQLHMYTTNRSPENFNDTSYYQANIVAALRRTSEHCAV